MRFKKFVKLYISDYACAWALKRLDKFWMRIVKCTLWSETEAMRIDMLKLAWKNSWNHIKLTFLAGFSLLDFGVTVGRESRHEAVVVAGRFAASHLLFTFSNYRSTTELVSSSCTDSFVRNLLVFSVLFCCCSWKADWKVEEWKVKVCQRLDFLKEMKMKNKWER